MEIKEQLIKALESIGWEIRGTYPNSWIYDEKKERTNLRVMGDRIEVENAFKSSFSGSICFHYKDSTVTHIDENAISFGTDECFINFYRMKVD